MMRTLSRYSGVYGSGTPASVPAGKHIRKIWSATAGPDTIVSGAALPTIEFFA